MAPVVAPQDTWDMAMPAPATPPAATPPPATPPPADDHFEIFNFYPGWARVLTVVGGLFCVLMPAWELRHAVLLPGWWTPFFGIIVWGARSVGGMFLVGDARLEH